MRNIMIRNGSFLTMEPNKKVLHGNMVISGNRITYIGNEMPPLPLNEYDEVIDGSKKLFMPGLVNTHGHAAMSLLRGYGDDLDLQVWLEQKMWPNEAKFTEQDVHWGTSLSILEMLKSGTTCFVDMYDKMDVVAQAVKDAGIRACLCRGAIGFGPADIVQAKVKEATDFARDWNGQANGRITTMMSPHSPYTCPPAFIEQFIQASVDLNIPIHTHMSETRKEVAINVESYGVRPAVHLEQLGVFARPCLVAHAVHVDDEELEILRRNHVHVSHNPVSNLKLASGIARVMDYLKAGILVSLGTDSSASNNNLDLFEEIRITALIHKGISGDPTAIPAFKALEMGTVDGARSIWLEDTGMLKPGMKADFIAIDLDQPHFQPQTDLISHLVYSASGKDVTDVWVDGERIIQDRNCLTMDEELIMFEANACYKRITG